MYMSMYYAVVDIFGFLLDLRDFLTFMQSSKECKLIYIDTEEQSQTYNSIFRHVSSTGLRFFLHVEDTKGCKRIFILLLFVLYMCILWVASGKYSNMQRLL